MRQLVFLEVEEIFKELLFLRFVIFLSDKALITTDLIITKNGSMYDLLQDKLIACVPNFVIDLTKLQSRKETVEHLIASSLQPGQEFVFSSFL